MKDERIQTTVNRFAAIGFFIWEFLLLISLWYRLLILKQHPREIWDIGAIFCFGIFFVFIACVKKGVVGHAFTRGSLLAICIGGIIVFYMLQFIGGRIRSVVDVGTSLIVILPAMGLCIGILHFLNRRWKRKEGIEDEQ